MRAKGVGFAVATVWVRHVLSTSMILLANTLQISNFIIGISVPPMIQDIGFGTYVFFATWCLIAAVFSWFCKYMEAKKLIKILLLMCVKMCQKRLG